MSRPHESHRGPARHRRGSAAMVLAGLVFLVAPALALEGDPAPPAPAPRKPPSYQIPPVRTVNGHTYVEQGGVRVTLGVRALGEIASGGSGAGSERIEAGGGVLVSLQVVDTGSGTPLRGLRPAGWLERRGKGWGAPTGPECLEKIRTFSSGGLSAGADFNLNQYYIYVLNSDNSVTVINPLVSFSRTKLVSIMTLPAAASDWALTPSKEEILVTIPTKGILTRIDTRRRLIAGEIEIGGRPGRIRIVDNPQTAWIGDESGGGVTAVRQDGTVAARFSVGAGPVLLASSGDGSRLFAAGRDRLAVMDARAPAILRMVDLPEPPTAVSVSALAGAVFVATAASGTLSVFDADSLAARGRIALKPGVSDVVVTPDGRWGLAANAAENTVDVFDVSTLAVTRHFDVEPGPYRIFFSGAFAYVRARGSASVTLIQWPSFGSRGTLPVVNVPIGQQTLGEAEARVAAASLEEAPGGGAVVASNRADRMIYYYAEGMMAPMGSFQNTSREPLAVKIVDASLRESAPGLYATDVRFEEGGIYDLPFVMDSPRIAGCFEVRVEDRPEAARRGRRSLVTSTFLTPEADLVAGTEVKLAFRLADPDSGQLLRGLRDVGILTFQPPGLFQARLDAVEVSEGVYEAVVTYPEEGEYLVLPSCRSRGADYGDLPDIRIQVKQPASRASGAGKE